MTNRALAHTLKRCRDIATGPGASRWLRRSLWLGVPLVLIPTLLQRRVIAKRLVRGVPPTQSPQRESILAQTTRIQAIVEEMKARLGMSNAITVSLVTRNELIVSVERTPGRHDEFTMQLEQDFIATLPEDELRAVVAHELGHVWISTHHPFLQTEELANEVALRAVSRQTLEVVYGKVWKRAGTKGSLAYLPVE